MKRQSIVSVGVVFVKLVSYPGGDMGPQRPLPANRLAWRSSAFPGCDSQVVPADNAWGIRDCILSEGFLPWPPALGHSSSAGPAAPYLRTQTCVLTSRGTEPRAWDVDKELAR